MIELADVIAQLRAELDRAMAAAEGEPLRFEAGPIEIEATVAVERVAGANGKVRFWVAELGGDAKLSHAATQRIKLTLNPKSVATDGSSRTVLVGDDAVEDER